MLLELVATIAAAFSAAGVMMLVNRLTGRRLPRWTVPAAAGAAMLAFAIWSEYSWFPRVVSGLPESVVVADRNESRAPWRPWTYAVPMVNRFIAVDRASVRTHEAAPGQRLVSLYLIARWEPTAMVTMLFDCPGARRADLGGAVEFGPDGQVANAVWRPVPSDDPILRAACAEV